MMANDCPKCARIGFPSPESVEAEQKKRLGEGDEVAWIR